MIYIYLRVDIKTYFVIDSARKVVATKASLMVTSCSSGLDSLCRFFQSACHCLHSETRTSLLRSLQKVLRITVVHSMRHRMSLRRGKNYVEAKTIVSRMHLKIMNRNWKLHLWSVCIEEISEKSQHLQISNLFNAQRDSFQMRLALYCGLVSYKSYLS